MALSLSIGDLSLTLNKFSDRQLPRTIIEPHSGVEYSIWGTTIGDGPVFQPKYVWSVTASVGHCQEQNAERMLGAIYAEFDLRRRTMPHENAQIRLIDTNQEIQEKAPRTRAIAPGTAITTLPGEYISYFAQFDVWFVQPPSYSVEGRIRTVNFSLQETGRVLP